MHLSDELLDKYFKGQCSPEEALVVHEYLNSVEDLPDTLLSKKEWDETKEASLTPLKSEQLFNNVKRHTTTKIYRLKWLKIISVAAIITVVFSIGLLTFNNFKQTSNLVKNKSTDVVSVINQKSVTNYTEQSQLLTLPDGSVAKIYPGAEVRYTLPFVKDKREVYLKGKGFFEVTKDKKHPFIVYARGISTTALGTSFTITAPEKSKFVKIQLHTGKVWVKNVDTTHHMMSFDKILLPGNELVYNSQVNQVMVRNNQISAPKVENDELSFTQAPLVEVFAKLQKVYKVKIVYTAPDLQEMSFTGSLKVTHSADSILKEITELNKLNYLKTAEGYLISK